jgi:CubicO group peptidase (beta-lactamase class C family)
MVRFARMHLAGGVAPDGTRLLTAGSVAAMRRKEADTPDRWTFGTDGWGLGWALYDWGGVRAFGHDGAAVSQHAFLRAVPAHDVAVALLTNGGGAAHLSVALLRELMGELTGARVPDALAPPPVPPRVDAEPLVGTYRREGMDLTVTASDGAARLRVELTGGMSGYSPPLELDLLPVQENVFAARGGGVINSEWLPIVFAALPDGTPCACFGMRVAPRIA